MVYPDKGLKISREKDIIQAEDIVNGMISEGSNLQQIACPADGMGAMVGIFYKKKESI